jgi:lipoate-protein ligase A
MDAGAGHVNGPTMLRLIPYLVADGPTQMAVDDWLLESAVAGHHLFRFYAWQPPTLSLGYFQPHLERLNHPAWATLPWVRRCTGGGAILHGDDLTYAVALPPETARKRRHADWHCELHRLMNRLLREAGLPTTVLGGTRPGPQELDYLCFTVPQPGDVMLGNRKVIGGAARAWQGALLQHGSVYEEAKEPLREKLPQALAQWLGLPLQEVALGPEEWRHIHAIAENKFRRASWNEKR